jgi:hypothetical protein
VSDTISKRYRRLWLPAALAASCAIIAAGCACEGVADDDLEAGDDDDAFVGESATRTIGPEGGEISAFGITFTVPAGAVTEPVEFTLAEAPPTDFELELEEPAELSTDGTWGFFNLPFRVQPSLRSAGAPFEVKADVGGAEDALPQAGLAHRGRGVLDGLDADQPSGTGEMTAVSTPRGVESGRPVFELPSTSDAVMRPLARNPQEEGARRARDGSADGILDPYDCDALVDAVEGVARPVDETGAAVSLKARLSVYNLLSPSVTRELQALLDGEPADEEVAKQLVLSVNRFFARACLAGWRAVEFYDDVMDLPMPREVNALASNKAGIAAVWEPAQERCGLGGTATGQGVSLYFNPHCQDAYPGFVEATEEGSGSWNHPDVDPATEVDLLEFTVAHELFHWLEDHLDGEPSGTVGIDSAYDSDLGIGGAFAEGAANAAAEIVFDGTHSQNHVAAPPWFGNLWNQTYQMAAFWRFLDWWGAGSDPRDSIIAEIMRAAPITGESVDACIDAMFDPEQDGYTRGPAIADYAVAVDFTHDFERAVDDPLFDATDDALGGTEDEEDDPGLLWGFWSSWSVGYHPEVDTLVDPVPIRFAPTPSTSLPDTPDDAEPLLRLDPWTARSVEVDLTGFVPDELGDTMVMTVRARAGSDLVDHVAVRLVHAPDSGRATLLGTSDSLSVNEESPSSFTISPAHGSEGKSLLFITNIGETFVNLELALDSAPPDRLYVLGRSGGIGGLWAFDVVGSQATAHTFQGGVDDLKLDGSARDLAIGGGLGAGALVTLDNGALAQFVLTGAGEFEVDLDGDPTTTDPDAPDGVSRLTVGTSPRGVAATGDGAYAVVALEDSIAIVDLTPPAAVVGRVEDLGLILNERPWDVVVLPDDSRAYVTPWSFNDPTDRLFVLDLRYILDTIQASTELLEVFGDEAMETIIDTGGSTNPYQMALSPTTWMLAVAYRNSATIGVIDTFTNTIIDAAPELVTNQFAQDILFEPSLWPIDVAWAPDESAVYAGFSSGYSGGDLSGLGVVRKCAFDRGKCLHEVGVPATMRAVTVVGPPNAPTVWAVDSNGSVTPLPDALFEPSTATLGSNVGGWLDGTGGCTTTNATRRYAVPCPEAGSIDLAGVALGTTGL